ncbi:MAG: HNH endonuclease, partial [Bradyrhizobium sp.]
EIGGKTLILGWWDQVGVFAAFDYSHHLAPLGNSPSIQIGDTALQAAHANGFAPYNKGNGELAIAFRLDFFGTYIENLEALHDCGNSAAETVILEEIAADPENVEESKIEQQVAKQRQYAVMTTKRALREIDFRDRVLAAYGHRCAMCGMQLRLLDAAHILPVADPKSTDQTCNGVALCALHHRAYDRAFVTFDAKYRVRHSAKMIAILKAAGHDGGLQEFVKGLRPLLILPPDKMDCPDPSFVNAANDLRGW